MDLRYGSRTDVGRVRSHNEDGHIAAERLWAVADGMGGHAAGDVASGIVIDSLTALEGTPPITVAGIVDALTEAHASIVRYGADHPCAHGLGTTVTGLARVVYEGEPGWAIFNVGDSRVYHLVDGELERITVDHSEIEELVARGVVTPEQARTHPLRHVITRCIGALSEPQIDVWILPTVVERFLVCSDGLNGELTDDRIVEILNDHPEPQDAADALVEEALETGGRDNVTVIVVNVDAVD